MVDDAFHQIPGKYCQYAINKYGAVKQLSNDMLIPAYCSDRSLYTSVNIRECGSNKTVTIYVHRLLALTFIPNNTGLPVEMLHVNHKDGNKLNNSLDNLEWVVRAENCAHAYRTGLRTDNNIVELAPANGIGEHLFFYSQAEAARFLGVPPSSLCVHMKGVNWFKPYHGYYVSSKDRFLGDNSKPESYWL